MYNYISANSFKGLRCPPSSCAVTGRKVRRDRMSCYRVANLAIFLDPFLLEATLQNASAVNAFDVVGAVVNAQNIDDLLVRLQRKRLAGDVD